MSQKSVSLETQISHIALTGIIALNHLANCETKIFLLMEPYRKTHRNINGGHAEG